MGRPRKVVTFTQATVDVPLTEKEQHVKARELAVLCDRIDAARAAAKADSSVARKAIRALEDERRLLAECVRTGTQKQNAQADLFKAPKTPTRAEAKETAPDEVADVFDAPAPSTGIDERDAFLANKSATTPPKTWQDADADASSHLGELIERAHEAVERDKAAHADTAPLRPVLAPSSASEFGDPWEDPPEDAPAGETPPATARAKRKAKNGTPTDGGPKAA